METTKLVAEIHTIREEIADNGRPFMIYPVSVTYSGDQPKSWTVDRSIEDFAYLNEKFVKPLNPDVADCLPTSLNEAFLICELQCLQIERLMVLRYMAALDADSLPTSQDDALVPKSERFLQILEEWRLTLNRYLAVLVLDQRLLKLRRVRSFLQLDAHLPCPVFDLGPFDKQTLSPSHFRFVKMIGKGGYGRVFLAEHSTQQKFYAIKVLEKNKIKTQRAERFAMAELSILHRNEPYPFLMRLHYAFQTEQKLYFVLDFINGGELFHHLQREHCFSVERSRFYAAEIALALGFLHSRKVIYRDLKLENILLDSEGHVVLIDFGLSRENHVANSFCGTPNYMAPEMLRRERYTCAVDWWSLGCTLYQMLFGRKPFSGLNRQELYSSIINDHLSFPSNPPVPNVENSIINELLNKDPSKRLGSSNDLIEVQSHPFFEPIDFDLLSKKLIAPPFKPNVASDISTEQIGCNFTSAPITSSVNGHDSSALASSSDVDKFANFGPFPPSPTSKSSTSNNTALRKPKWLKFCCLV